MAEPANTPLTATNTDGAAKREAANALNLEAAKADSIGHTPSYRNVGSNSGPATTVEPSDLLADVRLKARLAIQGDFEQAVQRIKGIRTPHDSALGHVRQSAARMQSAVDKARSLGATETQLAPVQAEIDATTVNAEVVARSIVESP